MAAALSLMHSTLLLIAGLVVVIVLVAKYGLAALQKNKAVAKPNKKCTAILLPLPRTVIPVGCTSPYTSSNLPGSSAGHANGSLFGLAPSGVYPATPVTTLELS